MTMKHAASLEARRVLAASDRDQHDAVPLLLATGDVERDGGDVLGAPAEQLGMDLVVSDPAALQKFLLVEIERWGKVVREHGIKAD